ncbi:MAG: hypothetical protein WBL55_20425, partial [Xanthobacteraceae bacterium]
RGAGLTLLPFPRGANVANCNAAAARRERLLKEIVPNLSSIAVLSNTNNPQSKIEMKEMQDSGSGNGTATSSGRNMSKKEAS